MAKLILDQSLCQRHGQCMSAAPEIMQFQDDGSMKVVLSVIPDELREAARDAVDMCPEKALRLEE